MTVNSLTAIVSIRNNIVKHHWFESREAAMRSAVRMAHTGDDIYWSMAEFGERSRRADAAQQLQNFWLDLDCGEGKAYPTKADAFRAFMDVGLPKPTLVVDSGNGLHIYWTLHEPVPAQQWKVVAEHLKRACITHSLDADHAVTADVARILRVPGTMNYKNPADPKPVRVVKRLGAKYSLAEFQTALPAVGPLRDAKPMQEPDEWSVDAQDFPPALIENVVRGCQQVRAAAKVQSNGTPEPLWRAVLSVAYRCEGGDQIIHKISMGDARYNPDETVRKAEGTVGPATCHHFESVHPAGCAGCPNKGAVKSPIAIPAPAPEPEPAGESEAARPKKVGDWHITARGVYRAVEVEGEVVKSWAVMTPVYGETFRTKKGETETDMDDAKVLLTWLRPDGKWRRTLMPLSLVGSPSKMMEWAGAQGLATLIPNAKVWIMYISELTNRLLSERQVTEYYARLGWHSDESEFILGTKKVTADGVQDATIERSSPLAGLKPDGDLDAWKAGVEILNQPGLEKHQFCVLAGFGAPLLQLMDVAGAAVSLAGSSGRGKTLAARVALSIYGNPDQLFQSADASKNSTDVHLATLHSVPYLMDEITNLNDKRIGDLLYMIANGRGKDTLNRSRAWNEGGSWRTLAFLTTNSPIMEASQSHLTEAQRNRAIELIVDTPVPTADASAIYTATSRNYGVAAQVYMQHLIQNRAEVQALAAECVEWVKRLLEGQDAQRFGIWALSAALAGGIIAKRLGLIQYDVEHILHHVIPSLKDQSEATMTPEEQFVQVVREWLAEHSQQVSVSAGGNLGVVDDPIARRDGQHLYLHSSRLKEALRDRKVSLHVVRDFLKKHARTGAKARLAQGTPPVAVVVLPTELIYEKE